jgi:uncharacterized membrane protein AbrB (regulator of aidB expression)
MVNKDKPIVLSMQEIRIIMLYEINQTMAKIFEEIDKSILEYCNRTRD